LIGTLSRNIRVAAGVVFLWMAVALELLLGLFEQVDAVFYYEYVLANHFWGYSVFD
jgi:hypothetical protein